jgi:hypothetical protein
MQVRQDDDIDLFGRDLERRVAREEDVLGLVDAVARTHLRIEEGADPHLAENAPDAPVRIRLFDEHRAAREGDAVGCIRRDPPLPERLGDVAEHRAPVEALAVADDGR